jgi:hypothetical protein
LIISPWDRWDVTRDLVEQEPPPVRPLWCPERIGVLNEAGTLFVKEGGLSTGWIEESWQVKEFALEGDRIGTRPATRTRARRSHPTARPATRTRARVPIRVRLISIAIAGGNANLNSPV